MKTFLVVSSEFSNNSGWGRTALEVSECLKNKGYEVLNISGFSSRKESLLFFNDFTSFHHWHLKKFLLTIFDLIKVKLKLKKKFDYILATDEKSLMLAYFISKSYKIPFSFICYGTYAIKILNEFNVLTHKKALKNVENIFISSSYSAQEFVKVNDNFKEKIKIIPLGISQKFLDFPVPDVKKLNEIVTVGAIKERKGLLELLNALNKIDNSVRPILNVLGNRNENDKYLEKVMQFIKVNKLEDFVNFYGITSDSEMIKILDRSKIFVLPSKNTSKGDFEGFGIVFIEASSRSIPVIGSKDCGNIDAIIENKTGFLIKQGDVLNLRNKILNLLINTSLAEKMGRNGRAFAKKMTWTHTTELILNNIKNL